MFVLGLVFAGLAALVTFPSLWNLVRAVFYVVRRLTVHYAPTVAAGTAAAAAAIEAQARAYIRLALYWAVGYFAVLAILIAIALAALKGGHTYIFGFTTFMFALVIWPMQKKLAFLASLSQTYLPTPLQLSEPKFTTLLMVIPIYSGVTAMLFPHLFLNGFGAALLVVLMVGTAWIVAFPTKIVIAPKVFAVLTAITIVSWVVLWIIPAHVEAATNYFKRFELSRGEDNLIAKLKERPIQKVNAPVLGWTVQTYENGDPVFDSNGFAIVTPCMIKDAQGQVVRMTLASGDVFKTLDVRVSVDAGEPLVQVYTPNSDGTWIVTPDSPKCWIPVSKTDLAVVKSSPASQPSVAPQSTPAPTTDDIKAIQASVKSVTGQQPSAARKQFLVNATAVYASGIWVTKGQTIMVKASGKVNSLPEAKSYDATYRWVGPDGWGSKNPGYISEGGKALAGPLPPGSSYLALAARIATSQPSLVDRQWLEVGSSKTFQAEQDGYLYFVVNEILQENGYSRMEFLQNNQGGFSVEVKVL